MGGAWGPVAVGTGSAGLGQRGWIQRGVVPSSAVALGFAACPLSVGTRGSAAEMNGSAFWMTLTWPFTMSKLSATLTRATELFSTQCPLSSVLSAVDVVQTY